MFLSSLSSLYLTFPRFVNATNARTNGALASMVAFPRAIRVFEKLVPGDPSPYKPCLRRMVSCCGPNECVEHVIKHDQIGHDQECDRNLRVTAAFFRFILQSGRFFAENRFDDEPTSSMLGKQSQTTKGDWVGGQGSMRLGFMIHEFDHAIPILTGLRWQWVQTVEPT